MTRSPRRAEPAIAVAVAAGTALVLAAGLRIGCYLEDEGVLLAGSLRVAHGQVPYRDFGVHYSPLSFYMQAALFRLFGVGPMPVRWLLLAFHAATAAGLYALGRRLAGRWAALAPPALYLLYQPADVMLTATFHNAPYPSWYALSFAVAAAWAWIRATEAEEARGRDLWLGIAGAAVALAFLSKQNAGLFCAAGIGGALLASPGALAASDGGPRPRRTGFHPWRLFRAAALALVPAATFVLVRRQVDAETLLLFVVPVAVLAAAGAAMPTRRGDPRLALRGAFGLVLGAGLVLAPWLFFFESHVGLAPFFRALFFLDRPLDAALYLPFPFRVPSLAVIATLALVAAIGGALAPRRWFPLAAGLATAATLGAGLTLAVVANGSPGLASHLPRVARRAGGGAAGALLTLSSSLDLLLGLAAVVATYAVVIAVRRHRDDEEPGDAARLSLAWIGVTGFLVFFPRMDAAHLVSAVPLLSVAALGVLDRPALDRFLPRLAAVAGLVVALTLLATKGAARGSLFFVPAGGGVAAVPTVPLDFPVGRLLLPAHDGAKRARLEAFLEVVREIERRVPPGGGFFAWPALPMLYVVTGRENPAGEDYFMGNNVTPESQRRILRALDDRKAPLVVRLADPADQFVAGSTPHVRVLLDGIADRYELDRRVGPYDLYRRREWSLAPPRGPLTLVP